MIRITPDDELRKFESMDEFDEVLPHLKKATRLAKGKIYEITKFFGDLKTSDPEFEILKSKLLGPVTYWRERMHRFGVRALENWTVEALFAGGEVRKFVLSEEAHS